MRVETRSVHIARDGREFPNETACRAYERETCADALVGLSKAEVEAARSGADRELAEAFVMFVNELRKARRRPNGPEAATSPTAAEEANPQHAVDSTLRVVDRTLA
jgi:hypothetical protein